MLHGLGFSVEYKRLLRVEEQVEQSIIRRMKQNDEESTFLLMLSCADKCSSTLTALTSQKQKLMIVERLSMGQVSSSPTSLFSPGDQGKFENAYVNTVNTNPENCPQKTELFEIAVRLEAEAISEIPCASVSKRV